MLTQLHMHKNLAATNARKFNIKPNGTLNSKTTLLWLTNTILQLRKSITYIPYTQIHTFTGTHISRTRRYVCCDSRD
uniref:Uncharacterized protein n=1 Tax=Octopus bimaculoides TaxID=37653 RepID=A0A0L8H4J8_OCTBM